MLFLRRDGTLHAISIVAGVVVDKWAAAGVNPTKQLAGGNIDGQPGNEIVACGDDPESPVAKSENSVIEAMEARHAKDSIQQLTHGIPRRINRLCDLALLVGYGEELRAITGQHIESIHQELIGSAAAA